MINLFPIYTSRLDDCGRQAGLMPDYHGLIEKSDPEFAASPADIIMHRDDGKSHKECGWKHGGIGISEIVVQPRLNLILEGGSTVRKSLIST